jgi:hypothetical protein
MSKRQLNWQAYIPLQIGIVPYVESAPGQAKTACFAALAEAAQRRYLPLELGRLLPEDIGGVPSPRTLSINGQNEDCVVRLLDEVLLRAKLEPSLVLLDEINQASHSMMAACQQWINPPPAMAWVAACGNPIEQASNGVEFTPPFVNRLCVVPWERPVDAMKEGWRNGFRNYPAPSFPLVPSTYLDDFGAYWGTLLAEFQDRHPELFGDGGYPKDEAMASKPWPSDRSWTNVGRLLCAADSVGADSTVKHHLTSGCVGGPAAAQWNRWLVEQNLPDPESVLASPQTLKLNARFDINRAIIAGVLARIRVDLTPQRWEAGYDVLEVVFGQQPEMAMSAEGALWKMKEPLNGYTPKIRNGAAAEMRKMRLATA